MAGYINSGTFPQRDFQMPDHDVEMAGSPTYSFPGSQGGSNEALRKHSIQNLVSGAGSTNSQGSSRSFGLASFLQSRTKMLTEPLAPAQTVEKVQKRRGPKPDSKPAQNRRQELNRAAQRTHRERKEAYVKSVEQSLEETRAKAARYARQVEQLKGRNGELETENRLMKQLLETNGIPFFPAHTGAQRTISASTSATLEGAYTNQHGSIEPNYKNSGIRYNDGLAPNTALSEFATPISTSIDAFSNPAYNMVGPASSNPLATPYTAPGTTSQDLSEYNNTQDLTVMPSDEVVPRAGFDNPRDPSLIEFVLEVESTCNNHADIIAERYHGSHMEEYNGHFRMLSAQKFLQPQTTSTQVMDLNRLLETCALYNRNGEITPVAALYNITQDPRYQLLPKGALTALQNILKGKSRCYGFGAMVYSSEVTDALDEICRHYLT